MAAPEGEPSVACHKSMAPAGPEGKAEPTHRSRHEDSRDRLLWPLQPAPRNCCTGPASNASKFYEPIFLVIMYNSMHFYAPCKMHF